MCTSIKIPQRWKIWFFSIFPIFLGAVRKIQLLALKSTRINRFSIFHFWDVLCNISSSGNMLTQKVVSNFFSKIPKNWLFYPKNGLFKLEMGFLRTQKMFYCKKQLKLFSKHPNLLKKVFLGLRGAILGPKLIWKRSILTYSVTNYSFFTYYIYLSSNHISMVFFYSDHATMDIFGSFRALSKWIHYDDKLHFCKNYIK